MICCITPQPTHPPCNPTVSTCLHPSRCNPPLPTQTPFLHAQQDGSMIWTDHFPHHHAVVSTPPPHKPPVQSNPYSSRLSKTAPSFGPTASPTTTAGWPAAWPRTWPSGGARRAPRRCRRRTRTASAGGVILHSPAAGCAAAGGSCRRSFFERGGTASRGHGVARVLVMDSHGFWRVCQLNIDTP